MNDTAEHRSPHHLSVHELKHKLNEPQQAALYTLENFGWVLSFVRDATDSDPPLVIVHDPDKDRYCVLDAEGELDENPIWVHFRE
jgi:hypothetical protein